MPPRANSDDEQRARGTTPARPCEPTHQLGLLRDLAHLHPAHVLLLGGRRHRRGGGHRGQPGVPQHPYCSAARWGLARGLNRVARVPPRKPAAETHPCTTSGGAIYEVGFSSKGLGQAALRRWPCGSRWARRRRGRGAAERTPQRKQGPREDTDWTWGRWTPPLPGRTRAAPRGPRPFFSRRTTPGRRREAPCPVEGGKHAQVQGDGLRGRWRLKPSVIAIPWPIPCGRDIERAVDREGVPQEAAGPASRRVHR